jgi:hypothetical protein
MYRILIVGIGIVLLIAGCGRTKPVTPRITSNQCIVGNPATQTGIPFSILITPIPAELARCRPTGEAITSMRFVGATGFGGTVGAVTDVTFRSFVINFDFSEVPCGGSRTRSGSIVFRNLRYRAVNNIGPACVARSRVDYTSVEDSSGFLPLILIAGQNILLPQLDTFFLPLALSAQTTCPPAAGPAASGQVWCRDWAPL